MSKASFEQLRQVWLSKGSQLSPRSTASLVEAAGLWHMDLPEMRESVKATFNVDMDHKSPREIRSNLFWWMDCEVEDEALEDAITEAFLHESQSWDVGLYVTDCECAKRELEDALENAIDETSNHWQLGSVNVNVADCKWACEGVAFEDHPHPEEFDFELDFDDWMLMGVDDYDSSIMQLLWKRGVCLVDGSITVEVES